MLRANLSLWVFLPFLFLACSTSKRITNLEHIPPTEQDHPGLGRDKPAEPGSRKVVFHAVIDISVNSYDALNRHLTKIAGDYKGYAVTLGNKRSVLRVEARFLEDVLKSIAQTGKIKSQVLTGNDVTGEYKDDEIRLENANKARDRYLELLAKAENVEAALQVEKELERLNTKIDLLKGRIERLGHLVAYSTIEVNIKEKRKMGILGYIGLGVFKAVKWLLVRD